MLLSALCEATPRAACPSNVPWLDAAVLVALATLAAAFFVARHFERVRA